jgi:hypothetical protein
MTNQIWLCFQLRFSDHLATLLCNFSQYDAWLGSNGATCTPEDLNRFKQQHELVKKIIAAYQSSDDSTDVVAGLISEVREATALELTLAMSFPCI